MPEDTNEQEPQRLRISFGATVPPLKEQLKGLVPLGVATALNNYADAITWLYVASLLSEAETRRARDRLTKKILMECKLYAGRNQA